jgi:hypothetical protein
MGFSTGLRRVAKWRSLANRSSLVRLAATTRLPHAMVAQTLGRDRQPANAMVLDALGDQPRTFRIGDERLKKPCAVGIGPGGANGLLHICKPAIQKAAARKPRRFVEQFGPKSGQHFEVLIDKKPVRPFDAGRPNKRCVPDIAGKPEIVGASSAHRNPHTGPINIGKRTYLRAGRNEECRFDLRIGFGEGNHLGTRRVGADQGNIPDTRSGRVRDRSGLRKEDELQFDPKLLGDGGRDVGSKRLERRRMASDP